MKGSLGYHRPMEGETTFTVCYAGEPRWVILALSEPAALKMGHAFLRMGRAPLNEDSALVIPKDNKPALADRMRLSVRRPTETEQADWDAWARDFVPGTAGMPEAMPLTGDALTS